MEERAKSFLAAIGGRGFLYNESLSHIVITTFKKEDMDVTTKVDFLKDKNKVGVGFNLDLLKFLHEEDIKDEKLVLRDIKERFLNKYEEESDKYNLEVGIIPRNNKVMFNFYYKFDKYEDYNISNISDIINLFLRFVEEDINIIKNNA